MYPWERVIPSQDSTLRIIHEAVKRGHEVSITHPSNLTIRESVTLSLCKQITLGGKLTSSITSFYKMVKFDTKMCPLSEFDVIFMREFQVTHIRNRNKRSFAVQSDVLTGFIKGQWDFKDVKFLSGQIVQNVIGQKKSTLGTFFL